VAFDHRSAPLLGGAVSRPRQAGWADVWLVHGCPPLPRPNPFLSQERESSCPPHSRRWPLPAAGPARVCCIWSCLEYCWEPEGLPGVYWRISETYADAEPKVRYAGLWAATYAGYPQFVPPIREVANDDQEDWVRSRAANILTAFESNDETQ
jgi:hypothetical protein